MKTYRVIKNVELDSGVICLSREQVKNPFYLGKIKRQDDGTFQIVGKIKLVPGDMVVVDGVAAGAAGNCFELL